jgi:mono/diheme cytochrome c family protein
MKMTLMVAAALLSSTALTVVFVARAQQGTRKAMVFSELEKAPEKARSRSNPLENDPQAAQAGGVLFGRHCAGCHGNNAEGGPHAPSLRAREVEDAPPGALFWVLTNGIVRHGMPVWSKLPEPQRWQLVSYLKSLGKQANPVAAQR